MLSVPRLFHIAGYVFDSAQSSYTAHRPEQGLPQVTFPFFLNISNIFCCYSPAENACHPQRSFMAALACRNALGSCVPSTPGVPPQRCHAGNSATTNPAINEHQFGSNAFSFWYKRRHKACTSGWELNEVKKVLFFSVVYTEGTED